MELAAARCIYCLRDTNSVTFTSREHVVAACLGSFENNPTLTGRHGAVCDECNARFSKLETKFNEDSWEGVHGQRLGIKQRRSAIVREKNFRATSTHTFGDEFFGKMAIFFQIRDGKLVPVLKDQIRFGRLDGGYRVFLMEELAAVKEGTAEYRTLVDQMKHLSQKDIHIFGETEDKVNRMVQLLAKFGVNYKEDGSEYQEFTPGTTLTVTENVNCTLDTDLGRVIAKIGFNYFAYCAIQDQQKDLLYRPEFDLIRNFIFSGEGDLKVFIPSITEEPLLIDEHLRKTRAFVHGISFLSEGGYIVARLTFFGLPTVYKVVLGRIPRELDTQSFGCGHIFDPHSGKIHNLSQVLPENLTPEMMQVSFGLSKRVRL